MSVGAFVQARIGSRRLPGKSLMAVWRDMPLLELVLRRVSTATRVDEVVLLTSDLPRDDPLAHLATGLGVRVHRGSEGDVLGRFGEALERHPAAAIVRVCADNPFVDGAAIDELIAFWRAIGCDYASNHTARSGLPDGTGAELLTAAALRRACAEARAPADREHVTRYVLRARTRFACAFAPAPRPPWPRLKLDIDTPGDYAAIRRVAARLPGESAPFWDRATIVAAAHDAATPRGA